MKLWTKILFLFVIIFSSLMGLIYAISSFGLQRSLSRMENEIVKKDIERVSSALLNELDSMDALVLDWATWDDTYNFIQDANQKYIQTNIVDTTFTSLKINLLLIIDSSGKVGAGEAFDLNDEKRIPVPPSLEEYISIGSQLVSHKDTESNIQGIIQLPEGLMLVDSRPILNSEGQGPIRGTLIMGRYLDAEEIQHIAQIAQVSLSTYRFGETQLTADLLEVQSSLSAKTPIIIRDISKNSIVGYSLLYDIYGKPALFCMVDISRQGYQLAQTALRTFIIILVVSGLLFTFIGLWGLNKWVLSRLSRLGAEMVAIGTSSNLSTRVSVQGKDEITKMASDVNQTLDALEKAQNSRLEAEASFKESEAKYRTLVEKSSEGVIVIHKGLLEFANSRMVEMTGYPLEETVGKSFIDYVAPEDRQLVMDRYNRRMSGEEIPFKYEISIIRKNGERLQVEINASVIEYQGRYTDMALIRDITERKQAEKEKQMLEAKAQINSRLAAVGEMAAGIAHEINNPLTSVIGLSQMLLEKQNIPEEIKEELKIINDSSQRMADIVKRLLTFARQAKPIKTSVNLNEIIDNTLKLRDYVLKTANINVITKFDPKLPRLVVDPGQMQQVFVNLIVNAEQAMKKAHGKGTLTITTEKKENNIRLSFQDDGPGITMENRKHLFEPFFTTKDVGEGTGLGLSLSRSIILEHGGNLSVESEFGRGANFIIELPLPCSSPSEIEIVTPIVIAQPSEKKIGKILVVDDEPGVRILLEKVLTNIGYSVETIADAVIAMDKLDAGEIYDVILIDIRMPGISGTEFYSWIIEKASALKSRIIIITGDIMGPDIKAFLAQNNLPYLAKPFDIELVKKRIDDIINLD